MINMSQLQRRLAARVLKAGKSRIWMDPKKAEDIGKAITATDIRKLVKKNAIKVLPEKVRKTGTTHKKRKGPGRRKGGKQSSLTRKDRWINTVRPLRDMLKELKQGALLSNSDYRKLRGLVKGGVFRSMSHLRIYLEQHDLLKKKVAL